MPSTPCRIIITPDVAVDVTIYTAGGNEAPAFTTENGSSAHTFPVTVAAGGRTTFWLTTSGTFLISALYNGAEIAGPAGAQLSVGLEPGGAAAVAPGIDLPSEQSSVSGAFLPLTGGTLTGDLIVPDEAYDATAWNGSLEVPTKNAVRDKVESLSGASGLVVVKRPFAFDTAGIVTPGVTIATPPAGSLFVGCGVSVPTTVFDGTTPTGIVGFLGEGDAQSLSANDLTALDANHDAAGHLKFVGGSSSGFTDLEYFDGTAVTVRLSDGADGDPNVPTPLSQGAGFAFLLYVPPTAFV